MKNESQILHCLAIAGLWLNYRLYHTFISKQTQLIETKQLLKISSQHSRARGLPEIILHGW